MVLDVLIESVVLKIFTMIREVMVWVSVVLKIDYLREFLRIN